MAGAGPKPTRIGGFEILERLADGPMGTVYKARQADTKRRVALRVLPIRLAIDRAYVQRFLRDARAAARLSHPNIVAALDVGQADGCHYLATEYVDGVTLRARLRETGRIAQNEALQIAAHVAAALQHAHERGMVHRHITPANILIARDGQVKLADMGLARPTDAADALTGDDATVVAAHYTAPEQIRGTADADIRADIYALGAVLYHMVTGQPPFDGPNPPAIFAKHISHPFPSAKDNNPRLSNATSRLVARMCARDPGQRPQTPAQLLEDIRPLIRTPVTRELSAPASPKLPAAIPVASGMRPRTKQALALGAIGAVGLVVLVVLLASQSRGPSEPEDTRTARNEEERSLETRPGSRGGPIPRPKGGKDTHARTGTAKRKQPTAQTEADRALAALRQRIGQLTAKDQFAQAREQVDAFARRHGPAKAQPELAALKRQIDQAARSRFGRLTRAADAAVARGDFAAARAALERAKAFGVPKLAQDAQAKLAEVRLSEEQAKLAASWLGVRGRVAKLIQAGEFTKATQELAAFEKGLQKLADGKGRPIERINTLKAELAKQQTALQSALRAGRQQALAACQAADDAVWALFRARKYAEADAKLDAASRAAEHPAARQHLAGTREAARFLKELWAEVERNLAGSAGARVRIGGVSGTLVGVKDGIARVQTGPVQIGVCLREKCTANEALAHARLGRDAASCALRALFLLAEGKEHGVVEAALKGAADAPARAAVERRLGALRRVARERAAREAWKKIEPMARAAPTQEQAKRLVADLEKFVRDFGDTDAHANAQATIKGLLPRARAVAEGWVQLFDGAALGRWKALARLPVLATAGTGQCGRVLVRDGAIRLDEGKPLTGIAWQGAVPATNYELCLEAQRTAGNSSFATMILPVGAAHCRLGVGGWGSIGLDSLDGRDYNANATTRRVAFVNGRWYRLHVRVTETRIEVSLDGQKLIDLPLAGHTLRVGRNYDTLKPLGVFCCRSAAAIRSIRLRRIDPAAAKLGPPGPRLFLADLKPGESVTLIDRPPLSGWRVFERLSTIPPAPVAATTKLGVDNGRLTLEPGNPYTAIAWTGTPPTLNYEISASAKRTAGDAEFCSIVFPVGTAHCFLGVGGWPDRRKRGAVGLGWVDGRNYNSNLTTRRFRFRNGRSYNIRVRVSDSAVDAWIDSRQVVHLPWRSRRLSLPPKLAVLKPLAVYTYKSRGVIRSLRLRRVAP